MLEFSWLDKEQSRRSFGADCWYRIPKSWSLSAEMCNVSLLIVSIEFRFTCKPEEWLDLSSILKPNLYNVVIKQMDGNKFFELSHGLFHFLSEIVSYPGITIVGKVVAVERVSWALKEEHLNPKTVHILDAQTAVFVWEGRKSSRILKKASVQIAGVLLRSVIRQDDEAGVLVEKQG